MAEDKQAPDVAPQEEGEIPAQERNGEPDFSKKHPLEYKWTLWFDNPKGTQNQNNWGQTLRAVYTFDTVEDFWCLYNNIKPPSWLGPGTDFHLFKEGVEPKWEDPTCEFGGKWTVLIPKSPNSKQVLDTYWLNAGREMCASALQLLACIGEQFTEGEEICGVVINVRAKQDKLCIWTKSASNEAAQVSIGKQLKQVLDIDSSIRIGYLVHNDAKRDDRKAKDRYLV